MLFLIISLLLGSLIKTLKLKPYSFFLIILGIFLGLLNNNKILGEIYSNSLDRWVNIHPHTLLLIFLPPLIYESSYNTDFHVFKNSIIIILLLTFFCVLLTTFFVAVPIYYISDFFDFKKSLLLGTILSATDPVAVVAILSELSISKKLSTLIEGESLLNDGLTIVMFNIVYKFIKEDPNIGEISIDIIRLFFGGLFIGLILTFIQLKWLKYIYDDVMSEITITIGFCYLIYFISEYTDIHTSGILGLVLSGLIMASSGKTTISPRTQETMNHIWELLSHLSNQIIFTLTGLLIVSKINFSEINYKNWIILISLYLWINTIRLFACFLLNTLIDNSYYKYNLLDKLVIVLSGLRGEISLALALFVNLDNSISKELRNIIFFYVSGIVFLTIIVNSCFINFLLNNYGNNNLLNQNEITKRIKLSMLRNSLDYLTNLQEIGLNLDKADIEKVKELVNINEINKILINDDSDNSNNLEINRKLFLHTLKKITWNLFEQNILSYTVVLKLIDMVDDSLDNINKEWGNEMNHICFNLNENIKTLVPLFCSEFMLYNTIAYNYDLVSGYIISQKETIKYLKNTITIDNYLNKIILESDNSLHFPTIFMESLESSFPNITKKIETNMLAHLLLNRQLSYLIDLKNNGEISKKYFDKISKEIKNKDYDLLNS